MEVRKLEAQKHQNEHDEWNKYFEELGSYCYSGGPELNWPGNGGTGTGAGKSQNNGKCNGDGVVKYWPRIGGGTGDNGAGEDGQGRP